MATFSIQPIDMINPPNDFSPSQDNQWTIIDGNTYTLWFILLKKDVLGTRRYSIANTSNVQIVFPRATLNTQPATGIFDTTIQTITLPCTPLAADASMFNFTLTSAQTTAPSGLVGGSVQIILTEGANVTTFNQAWCVNKKMLQPGN